MTTPPDATGIPELVREIARIKDRIRQISEIVIEGDRLADGVTGLSRNVQSLADVTERIEENARRLRVVEHDLGENKEIAQKAEEVAVSTRADTARRLSSVIVALLIFAGVGVTGAVWLTSTRQLLTQQCEERQAALRVNIAREEMLARSDDPPDTRPAHARSAVAFRALLKDCP